MEQLRSEGLGPGNGQIEWLELDLSDPRKAERSAEDFLAREDRLDMLGGSGRFLSVCVGS